MLPNCRYKNLRQGTSYSEAVFKLLDNIQRELEDKTPARQAFLRLLKHLVDFVVCVRHEKKPAEEIEENKGAKQSKKPEPSTKWEWISPSSFWATRAFKYLQITLILFVSWCCRSRGRAEWKRYMDIYGPYISIHSIHVEYTKWIGLAHALTKWLCLCFFWYAHCSFLIILVLDSDLQAKLITNRLSQTLDH